MWNRKKKSPQLTVLAERLSAAVDELGPVGADAAIRAIEAIKRGAESIDSLPPSVMTPLKDIVLTLITKAVTASVVSGDADEKTRQNMELVNAGLTGALRKMLIK